MPNGILNYINFKNNIMENLERLNGLSNEEIDKICIEEVNSKGIIGMQKSLSSLSFADKYALKEHIEKDIKTIQELIKEFYGRGGDKLEYINFKNYYGWFYTKEIKELQLVKVNNSIRKQIENINFNF